jgi:hypothetical protein
MHQTDSRRLVTEMNPAACAGRPTPLAHAPLAEPTLAHRVDVLPDGPIYGWESAWIDLGGEG